jgi:CHRD domain
VNKRRVLVALAAVLTAIGGVAAATTAAGGVVNVRASLTGYEETPAVSTTANGTFTARQVSDGVFEYSLSYSDLESEIRQAHIHFGQPGVMGGISVFLCTDLGNGPAGTQTCPDAPATITGTISAADVIGPAAQGIDPGELDELVAAIDSGMAYCNIHSVKWPTGEARGVLGPGTGQR